jgi:tRNA1Val (adenine37-N6)-methyltransferase
MGQPHFTFKQFEIFQDRCAMKVSTDSIVLGSWAPVQGCRRILDVGTGTGILALMLAQRTPHDVQIDAVELDPAATEQAEENVNQSPWRERIRVIHQNVLTYAAPRYDLIVTNPPYFLHGQILPDAARQRARHTGELDHQSLLAAVQRLLAPDGLFALILPVDVAGSFVSLAAGQDWHVQRRCAVETRRGKTPALMLLVLTRSDVAMTEEETLCLREADHRYSAEFTALADAFYLNMAG